MLVPDHRHDQPEALDAPLRREGTGRRSGAPSSFAAVLLESTSCLVIRSGRRSSTRRARPTPSGASSSPSWLARSPSRPATAGETPTRNPALGLAVQKARDASMPKDNIQRAIDRGTGEGADAAAIESVSYEGYGPGGAAILVETLTDNRNRTGSEIRHAFERNGGSLGEPGSVAWQFENRGVILVDGERYGEDDLMPAIDAGAEDVIEDGDLLKVTTTRRTWRRFDRPSSQRTWRFSPPRCRWSPRAPSRWERAIAGAAPSDGRARGARRRRLRARELRHAGRDVGEGRGSELGAPRATSSFSSS